MTMSAVCSCIPGHRLSRPSSNMFIFFSSVFLDTMQYAKLMSICHSIPRKLNSNDSDKKARVSTRRDDAFSDVRFISSADCYVNIMFYPDTPQLLNFNNKT